MKFLITGGCGYIGTRLTKFLLSKKHKVLALDSMWFKNHLKKHKNLKVIKADVRNFNKINIKNTDVIIHLANVANDPSVELNPNLSWEINVLASKLIAEHAIKNKVKKIIFFSSGSVYGVKKEKKVTEDLLLEPISTYNKTKMIAERVFLSYKKKIDIKCLRPATVCGLSERLRLDITVNKLTFDAHYKNKIFVDGGSQIRPNVYIDDLIGAAYHFSTNRRKLKHDIYNVGFENYSILKIAKKIQKKTGAQIIVNKNRDIRSYRQNSDRLIKTGFKPKYNIEFAMNELIDYFKNKKMSNFSNINFNLKRMKQIGAK
jgi:nucleoside-diphosphate-sugar epimerase|tara:strand:+ start:371 stop:1318 length:948 start_codon:yes stop_codon:yes gene_type:complete